MGNGMKRWPLVATFVLFIAMCISAAYWATQLFRPSSRPIATPPQAIQPAPRMDAAAALFGGRSAIVGNFQLKGVVVANNAAESIAILAADGKPAQAFRINSEVTPGVRIKEIHLHHVLLSEGGVLKRVELREEAKGQAGADIATFFSNTK